MNKHIIVLISGKAGSGKTTLADNISKELSFWGVKNYRTRFAKSLYEMHNAVRDIGRAYGIPFEDKVRKLLVWLGTDLVRNDYGEDSWVSCVKHEIKKLEEKSVVIIDDCRFLNEANAFDREDYAVVKVRLECDREVRKGRCEAWKDESEQHPSETDLDGYGHWHAIIDTGKVSMARAKNVVIKLIDEVIE